jgi:nucleoside-diphosphate-sugar epimerase
MKFALTGAGGYVGSFFLYGLRDQGHEVVPFGRAGEPYELGDRPDLTGFDALIHCAFSHVDGKFRGGEGDDPEGFVRLNRDGSLALFEAAKTAGVRRVIFLSSRAVYGPRPKGTLLTEDMACTPDTLYGQMKLDCEDGLKALADNGFKTTSLRATGVYGASVVCGPHKWREMFADFREGKPINPRNGTEVHGRDVCSAAEILLAAEAPPQTVNVSDMLMDRHDVLGIYAGLKGYDHPLPERSSATPNQMDCTRLRQMGWQPRGEQGLRDWLATL